MKYICKGHKNCTDKCNHSKPHIKSISCEGHKNCTDKCNHSKPHIKSISCEVECLECLCEPTLKDKRKSKLQKLNET